MIDNTRIRDFLNVLSDDKPTPGGGSVAAIVAAMGAGLCLMAMKISMNRKAFQGLDSAMQQKLIDSTTRLNKMRKAMVKMADTDVDCFDNFMIAHRNKDEIAIKKATKECFNAPYKLALMCLDALEEVKIMNDYIVDSVVSDLQMSYILLEAALRSCDINMKINMTKYIDAGSINKYKSIIPMIDVTLK